MTEAPEFECPHCGGRLARGVSLCLHCGSEVTAPPEESSGDATKRLILIAVMVIAVIGAVSGVLVSMVTEEKPNAAQSDVTCLDPSMGPQIANIQRQGWKEVDPQGDKRCFKQ